MESIYKINQRVWDTRATEIHSFSINGEEYVLIQSEHPSGSHGNSYIFDTVEDEPLIYINWQASGVNIYVNQYYWNLTVLFKIIKYLLDTDVKLSKQYLDHCYLQIQEADEDDEWLQFRYF